MSRKQAWELAGWTVASVLFFTVFLWLLPFLLTVVGALLPIAAIGLLVRYVARRRPWRRP
jgi:hypothetical protein